MQEPFKLLIEDADEKTLKMIKANFECGFKTFGTHPEQIEIVEAIRSKLEQLKLSKLSK